MSFTVRTTTLAIILATSSLSQAPAQSPRPEFEVASIKPWVPSAANPSAGGLQVDGAQIHVAGLSLRDLLGLAYRIKATLITGPDWTASERFEISATLPPGSGRDKVPEMVQSLLADRFRIKTHRDKKEFPVYALVTAKGPLKLKEVPPNPDDKDEPGAPAGVAASSSEMNIGVNFGHGTSFTMTNNRFTATKMSTGLFAGNIERFADRQVVDETGLTGQYDFAFDITPEDYRAMLLHAAVWSGATLPPQALQMLQESSPSALGDALGQVGLKLEPKKAPLDVLVIDDALKTPTAN